MAFFSDFTKTWLFILHSILNMYDFREESSFGRERSIIYSFISCLFQPLSK